MAIAVVSRTTDREARLASALRRAISAFTPPAERALAVGEALAQLAESGTVARDALAEMEHDWRTREFRHGDFTAEFGHDHLLIQVLWTYIRSN